MTREPAVQRLARDVLRHNDHLPADQIAATVAAHLEKFWEPRMLAEFRQLAQSGALPAELAEVASALPAR